MPERKKSLARALARVSLEQYATMLAGLEDGIPLDELLAFAGVDRRAWPSARERWEAQVVADLARRGILAEQLEAAKMQALLQWERPLPPIDHDLRAYLDFDRALAAADDQEAFLSALGLRVSDPMRLQAIWAKRFEDPDVAEQTMRILAEPPGGFPDVQPGAARLPARNGVG